MQKSKSKQPKDWITEDKHHHVYIIIINIYII